MKTATDALVEALEAAQNGLRWYQDMYPLAGSCADDEMHEQIDAALALARAEQAEPAAHADHCGTFDERNACTCVAAKTTQKDHIERNLEMVPDGWVCVPREPTNKMLDAVGYKRTLSTVVRMWNAMIAAAPPLPKGGA